MNNGPDPSRIAVRRPGENGGETGTAPPQVSLRIAVVGCGAIARAFHVPALVARPDIRDRLVLVDPARDRAEALRAELGAGEVRADHREIARDVDGAVIAVPQELHAEVGAAFLEAGVPVLCEKPLAGSVAEASALVEASRGSGAPLGVNNVRRFFPAVRAARQWIRSGGPGPLRKIEIYEGAPFDWPLASGSTFGRGGTGKGVLQDLGAHALDMVCWWLGERPEITSYLDDAMGGSEAVARVEFRGDGYSGVVHLSWLSRLSNTFRIEGEGGTMEGEIRAWDTVTLTGADGVARRVSLKPEVPSFPEVKDHVIDDFLAAVRGGGQMAVPGAEVLPSIRMIEECYGRRRLFPMPWLGLTEEVHDAVA